MSVHVMGHNTRITQNTTYCNIPSYPTTIYSGVNNANLTVFAESVTSVLPLINAPFLCYPVWFGRYARPYQLNLYILIQNGLYHLIMPCQVLSHPLSVQCCSCRAKFRRSYNYASWPLWASERTKNAMKPLCTPVHICQAQIWTSPKSATL